MYRYHTSIIKHFPIPSYREKYFSCTDDDPAHSKNQPSIPKLESRRRFSLFDDLHADRRVQRADIRREEGSEEIDRDYTGDEERAESGE